MISIQLIGIAVSLMAIHLTYLYYKRSDFTKKELYLWLFIWLAFVFVTIFPKSVQPIVGKLGLRRTMDLIMIVAFIVLFVLTFYNYVTLKETRTKLVKLVRDLALKDLDQKEK